MSDFPINKIRQDFPILRQQVHGKPLIYFDNGATSQKPESVIRRMESLYRMENASIHRSVTYLSDQMTQAYEQARDTVRDFIHATHSREVIFTSGATGSINLVASSFAQQFIQPGDEVVISIMEHHSNLVPWQMVRDRYGAVLKVVPITRQGELDMEAYRNSLTDRTRIVAITHVSNALGTVNPVHEIVSIAHERGIPVLLDGAQAIQHGSVDVQEIDCDFYVFSGHKVFGPTGIGVLYGKEHWLEQMPPWQGGGDMIEKVTIEKTTYNELPLKFEAGTTHYAGAIGLAEALNYLQSIGLDRIQEYEQSLLMYGEKKLQAIENMNQFSQASSRIAIFSFLLNGIHPYDTGIVLDKFGIAVRTGTHCTQPLMDHLGIEGTIRASLCFYNTTQELDALAEGLAMVNTMFG